MEGIEDEIEKRILDEISSLQKSVKAFGDKTEKNVKKEVLLLRNDLDTLRLDIYAHVRKIKNESQQESEKKIERFEQIQKEVKSLKSQRDELESNFDLMLTKVTRQMDSYKYILWILIVITFGILISRLF